METNYSENPSHGHDWKEWDKVLDEREGGWREFITTRPGRKYTENIGVKVGSYEITADVDIKAKLKKDS